MRGYRIVWRHCIFLTTLKHGRSVENSKYVWRNLWVTPKCFTQCISHVPVGLDVVRRQRDLADVAELRAVDVGQGVADVAADRSKLLLSWKMKKKICLRMLEHKRTISKWSVWKSHLVAIFWFTNVTKIQLKMAFLNIKKLHHSWGFGLYEPMVRQCKLFFLLTKLS